MLQTIVFYIFIWWFQKIENRKALIARSVLASMFAIIYWICAVCMLVVDDIPIMVGIIMIIPAVLFTIRAVLDIKKLYNGDTSTSNEHKSTNNGLPSDEEYKGYFSKYANQTTQQTQKPTFLKQNDTRDDFDD